ncbi:hypothetical protein Cv017_05745 [Chromobacterium subtsugae]|nr:hypothetical protein Cv017_05745 [Chromobacterium subtsugae]
MAITLVPVFIVTTGHAFCMAPGLFLHIAQGDAARRRRPEPLGQCVLLRVAIRAAMADIQKLPRRQAAAAAMAIGWQMAGFLQFSFRYSMPCRLA